MSEYSGFILVKQKYFGTINFVRYHRMSENSGVGLDKFYYIYVVGLDDGAMWFVIIQNEMML